MKKIRGITFIQQVQVSAHPRRTRSRPSPIGSRRCMRIRHKIQPGDPDDFMVRTIEEMANVRKEATQTMTALLASIAGVSLLVGGIGIMNIMLVSVTERTREIGLRMAIGARGRDVLLQFLVEAVVLSLFGGGIGIALGVGPLARRHALAGLADRRVHRRRRHRVRLCGGDWRLLWFLSGTKGRGARSRSTRCDLNNTMNRVPTSPLLHPAARSLACALATMRVFRRRRLRDARPAAAAAGRSRRRPDRAGHRGAGRPEADADRDPRHRRGRSVLRGVRARADHRAAAGGQFQGRRRRQRRTRCSSRSIAGRSKPR